ncbi:alpha/beta hydrolase domain-containing protein [Mycobacteroides abscessus subsp. abscessus]|nr:alpha/beta hydrolase domain-containing protein [Mycobacteroides abscessus subsp. abscessus]
MSALSIPVVADLAARVLHKSVRTRPAPSLRFTEIPSATDRLTVPTRHGPVPVTVYRPPDEVPSRGVYVNFHGGGFVLGDYEQDDPWCRYLAANALVTVVNVDYALSPRHRFPVAIEQGYDVLRWAHDVQQDWDTAVLCVGGQSAGGAIAAGVARIARDAGVPGVDLQVLHYAPLDLATPGTAKTAKGSRAMITPWLCELFNTAYIPDQRRRRLPLASPAWADNLDDVTGLAPAVVITCELDRLRDEGVRFAEALGAVGALALHYDVPDVDHAYNIHAAHKREATEAVYRMVAEQVKRAIDSPR